MLFTVLAINNLKGDPQNLFRMTISNTHYHCWAMRMTAAAIRTTIAGRYGWMRLQCKRPLLDDTDDCGCDANHHCWTIRMTISDTNDHCWAIQMTAAAMQTTVAGRYGWMRLQYKRPLLGNTDDNLQNFLSFWTLFNRPHVSHPNSPSEVLTFVILNLFQDLKINLSYKQSCLK